MTKHTASTRFLTRRLFTAGTGLAAASAWLPGLGVAFPTPGRVGDVDWRVGDSFVPGYHASAGAGKPVVVVIHGMRGLDTVTRNLCQRLAGFDLHAIAPDLFRRHQGTTRRLAAPAVRRDVLHSVSTAELQRDLSVSVDFARAEGADVADCTFLALNTDGTRFTRSSDTRFASVTTYSDPRLGAAFLGTERGERSQALIDLVSWIRS